MLDLDRHGMHQVAAPTAGECTDAQILAQIRRRDAAIALRDRCIAALRGQPPTPTIVLARRLRVTPCRVGRMLTDFPRYFTSGPTDHDKDGTRIALHPHLAAHA